MRTNQFCRVVLFFMIVLQGMDSINAQNTSVSGMVSDKLGPLPGTSVRVKDSTISTIANSEGFFQIETSGDATLIFSFIGYITQEVHVKNRNRINVVLEGDLESIDEVVVVGYGTQKRKELTTAVTSVKESDFNQGGVSSPMDLIQGKVAGLNITKTQGNNPNSSASIQLRGVSSLTGDISPLVVIDGIPGGNLDLLQQDDIATIDVLKDGSAAAIYGTRGNAGVILITTKKGKPGRTTTEYNSYFQTEFVDKKPKYLSASQFKNLISQGIVNADQDFGYTTDLYDDLINKNNLSQYHNLAVSGGSMKTNYRASLFYNNAEGLPKKNSREQFGGRISINHKGLNNLLTLQSNVAANFNKANLLGGSSGDFEQAIQRNPTAPIYNEDGSFYQTFAYNNYNPLSRLADRVNERDQQTFSGDMRATLDFSELLVEGLKASIFGSYVRNAYNDRQYRSKEDWDQREGSEYQGMGYAYKANHIDWSKTIESIVEYNTTIASNHSIGAIMGYSYQYTTTETFDVSNNGFTTDGFLDWNMGAGSAIQNNKLPRPGIGSFKEDNTLVGFFGRVNYAYKDRYFAQVVMRREGSSRFGTNHKWGTFPAVSVGWTMSEESFMEDVSFINNLKFRLGYGVTGNQGIPNYQSFTRLSTGGVYPLEGVFYQTYGASNNPNNDLKWEEKHEINFGVDFRIFDNNLSGTIDIYNRTTKDLLYNYTAQLPAYIHSTLYTNVGEITNKGVELFLSYTAIKKQNFSWDVEFTGSYGTNKLSKLSNENFQATYLEFGGLPAPGNLGNAIRLEEGGSVGNFYGKRFAGFTDDGKWLFYKADGTTAKAGDMNEEDLMIIGNGVPKYQASLSNKFRYKNLDLSIFFRGKFGYDILNTKEMYFGNKKWLPNNLFESAFTTHAQLDDDPQYSDYYIEKGNFVKLDNVTIGYNLNIKSKYINKLRIYLTGRNLATITAYKGIDPELQDTGFETGLDNRGFYPRTKTWTIGLNVKF
ncbi:MAG: SusC/RagA family TonB-linked outer membrane protein [Bacteroidales bacterium]